jgi:hypothetical protein
VVRVAPGWLGCVILDAGGSDVRPLWPGAQNCSAVRTLAVARFAWAESSEHARALMFTVLVVGHLLYAFAVRRPRASASA